MPFGPWPGVSSGGGGGVTAVNVTAPITKSGPATTPNIGLDVAADGSLVVSGGELTRGPLAEDVTANPADPNVKVVAFHESGGNRLTYGAVADPGVGFSSILLRPGGTSNVVGFPVAALVQSVSVTAPIQNGGTASNPNIELGLAGGGSLVVSGGLLERGPLAKDINSNPGDPNCNVVAFEETGGPTRLAFGVVPDEGAGFDAILTRPGGTTTAVGKSNSDLGLPKLTITYHISLPASVLYGVGGIGGWVYPGTFSSLASLHIETLLPPQGSKTRVTANVEANSLSAGAQVLLDMTRNGLATAPNTSVLINPGITGHFDSGLIIPTLAANDSFGLVASQPIQLATGTIDVTVTIFVY